MALEAGGGEGPLLVPVFAAWELAEGAGVERGASKHFSRTMQRLQRLGLAATSKSGQRPNRGRNPWLVTLAGAVQMLASEAGVCRPAAKAATHAGLEAACRAAARQGGAGHRAAVAGRVKVTFERGVDGDAPSTADARRPELAAPRRASDLLALQGLRSGLVVDLFLDGRVGLDPGRVEDPREGLEQALGADGAGQPVLVLVERAHDSSTLDAACLGMSHHPAWIGRSSTSP